MTNQPERMNFEQFRTHLQQVFEQVRASNQPVLVERNGETYRLEKEEPQDIWEGYDPERARKALAQAAGALAGVDTEELLADIHAQRAQGGTHRPE